MRPYSITPLAAALLAAACAIGSAPAAANDDAKADAFVCMEETQAECDHKNKNLELYIKGHDAYERGRQTGDFNEARNIALELQARGDARHGKTLIKHIYMQVAQGTHKDLVEAYRWVAADIAAGVGYTRLPLERVRDALAAKMSPEQLARAQQ